MTLAEFQDLQDTMAARIGISRNQIAVSIHPDTVNEMLRMEGAIDSVQPAEDGFIGEFFGSRVFVSASIPPGGFMVRPDPTRYAPMGLGADRMHDVGESDYA